MTSKIDLINHTSLISSVRLEVFFQISPGFGIFSWVNIFCDVDFALVNSPSAFAHIFVLHGQAWYNIQETGYHVLK